MAQIVRRKMKKGFTYLARLKRVGFKTISKTFYTKEQAKKWARTMERKLDQGEVFDYTQASRLIQLNSLRG